MSTKAINTLLIGFSLLALPAGNLLAQTPSAGHASPNPASSSSSIQEKVVRYLESDIFITEGYGLKKVHVGQSIDDLVEKIGAPQKISRTSLFGGSRKLYYRIDSSTQMLVIADKHGVSQVVFEGNMSSAYSTYGGARFGMSFPELRMIYGNGIVKKNTIRYPRKGIGFSFDNGRLKIIQIFKKES